LTSRKAQKSWWDLAHAAVNESRPNGELVLSVSAEFSSATNADKRGSPITAPSKVNKDNSHDLPSDPKSQS